MGVRDELIDFVKQSSLNAKEGERLLGSSEIIESVFGKLKSLEQDQSKSGFTSMLLSLPSMLSKTTQAVIHNAFETVPTKKIYEWVIKKYWTVSTIQEKGDLNFNEKMGPAAP